MSDLTDDELTVLMIAARDQSMIPIGRWERPVKDLAAKGLLKAMNEANYVITDMGRIAAEKEELGRDKDLARALKSQRSIQTDIGDFAEQAAQLLAKAARASTLATGNVSEVAARKWAKVILDRALELLSR